LIHRPRRALAYQVATITSNQADPDAYRSLNFPAILVGRSTQRLVPALAASIARPGEPMTL
jgi:hypothetical protein